MEKDRIRSVSSKMWWEVTTGRLPPLSATPRPANTHPKLNFDAGTLSLSIRWQVNVDHFPRVRYRPRCLLWIGNLRWGCSCLWRGGRWDICRGHHVRRNAVFRDECIASAWPYC